MVVDQHVVGASGVVGIDILAAIVRVDLVSHQCTITLLILIAFEKQDHADPVIMTALDGQFIMAVIVVRVFGG